MTPIDFAQQLNPEQLAAVTHGEGPQLVLAGAGSGKTRVITYRIAWLVRERGVDPGRIAAVTFTNKAANEMKERVEELLEIYPLPSFVGTFHRFALRQLRAYGDRVGLERGFAILDASDQKTLLTRALREEGLSEESFRPQAVLAALSGAKNRLLGPTAFEREADDFFRRRVAPVYHRYQKLMREANAVDFDDMIRLTVNLLRGDAELRGRLRRRYPYLLIDEFQDTNHAQLGLIHELSGSAGHLTAVGDEDQSIYRWRGAELHNILDFERTFPNAEIRKLERNYRSTQVILDAAGGVVEHNVQRRGKRLWTEAGGGEKIVLYRGRDEQDEARWVANTLSALEGELSLTDMAILVRTHAQTRSFEDVLLSRRLPYRLIGGLRFYERAEIKDLVAYLRLIRQPRDPLSFRRVLNRPPRGIGQKTQKLLERRAEEHAKTLWDVLADNDLVGFPSRACQALRGFHDLISALRAEAESLPLPALLERVLEHSRYTELYDKGDDESRSRLENIQEFVSATQEFTESHAYGSDVEDLLEAFLDHASLASELDNPDRRAGLSLMTLHSAKGLEFSLVVVAGLEEDLLPHFNAQSHPDDLEEERRLLYVGMTRAKKRLLLTTCRRRRIAGRYQDQRESRFLREIPEHFLEIESSPALFRERHAVTANVHSFFGRPQQSMPSYEDESQEPPPAAPSPARRTSHHGDRLRRGSRVLHSSLGRGKVLEIDGSGDDRRLVVYFDGVGKRKLVAKYANLEVL